MFRLITTVGCGFGGRSAAMDGNPCVDLMFGRKGLLYSVRVRVDIPQF